MKIRIKKNNNNLSCLYFAVSLTLVSFLFSGCKKFLDETPDKQLTTPKTIKDLRAILDNNGLMNASYCSYGAIASDDYYVKDDIYTALTDVVAKNYYVWGLIEETADRYNDWQTQYARLFYANVVIDYFDRVKKDGMESTYINAVKGEALFYRAFTMFAMLQIFALPYNPSNASVTLGLPYKMTSDINEPITRPSLEECYLQVINDLTSASELLPVTTETLLRPKRSAAFLALANAYLVMQQFGKAQVYADSCLKYQNELIDYKNVSSSSTPTFALFNKEVIWQADLSVNMILSTVRSKVDSTFYESYNNDDLRKQLFFAWDGSAPAIFKGHYNGNNAGTLVYFSGLAVNESYLVKSECEARMGKTDVAMATLNLLLQNRYNENFQPISASSPEEAVEIILRERRKELCFRGVTRWMDIRRLNELGNQKIIPKRIINSTAYTLEPDDPHYAFLIPNIVIDNSKISQNAR